MNDPRNFSDIVGIFTGLIDITLPVFVALALLVFFKGLIAFIAKSGDAKNHAEGRSLMIWGLVALFVMVSVFGILRFARTDIGFRNPFGDILPLLPQ